MTNPQNNDGLLWLLALGLVAYGGWKQSLPPVAPVKPQPAPYVVPTPAPPSPVPTPKPPPRP